MMEVCRRPAPPYAAVTQTQALPTPIMPNYVHSTNGSVTLTFNNQITNQVCILYFFLNKLCTGEEHASQEAEGAV